jgi:hypothetical protein
MIAEDGRSSDGKINDGDYTLTDAPIGKVKVQIGGGTPKEMSPEEFKKRKAEGAKRVMAAAAAIRAGKVPEKVPEIKPDPKLVSAQYGDPKKTPLTYEVKPGKQTHDFDLVPLPPVE